jgi:hypothetical protein
MPFTKHYVLDRASGILDSQLLSSLTSGTFTFSSSVALGAQSWTMPSGYIGVITIEDEQIMCSALSIAVGVVTATIGTNGRGYSNTTAATHPSLSAVEVHVVKSNIDNIQDYLSTLSDTGLIVQNTVTTIVSATSHTIAGDQTSIFKVGRVFVFAVSGTYYRAVITASAFGAVTTITLNGDALPSSGTITACGFEFGTNTNKPIDYSLFKSATNAPTLNAPSGYVWLYSKGDGLLVKDSNGNIRHLSTVVTTVTSTAGAVTLDLALSNFFELTLTENVTSITPSNGADGQVYTLRIKQAAGLYTVTLGASFRFNTTVPGYSANQVDGAFDYVEFTYNADGTLYDIRGITTGTQASITTAPNSQTLGDAANIAWGLAAGTFADVTLGGNRTLNNPTGMSKQQLARLIIYQDDTGGRTLAFGSSFAFTSSVTLSTSPLVVDILDFQSDGTKMYCTNAFIGFGWTGAYFSGGFTGGSGMVATTDALNFATDTTTMVTRGAMATARIGYGAGNSPSVAYFSGGSTAVATGVSSTATNGLLFATDTTTQVTKGVLSQARVYVAGANSPTVLYSAGGQTVPNSGATVVTTTDGLTFSTDTTTQVTRGALTVAREGAGGFNSSTRGYFAGGATNGGLTTITDGLTFATDTVAQVTKGALTASTTDGNSSANSKTIGYTSISGSTVVNGLTFASDTTAQVTKGALSTSRGHAGAANSGLAAYFSGGDNGGSTSTVTHGLTFATDTTTMVTKGALTVARGYIAGAQGSTLSVSQIA